MSNDFPALSLDEAMRAFKNVLQSAWPFHRKAGPNQSKENYQKQKHQELHGNSVGDRRLRMVRLNVQRPQQSRDRAGEQVIQDFSKPELFGHGSGFSHQSQFKLLDFVYNPRASATYAS
jgi:hypothetical protein